MNHLAVLPLWYSRLTTITSPKELDPALTSCCTHHRTSNLPTDVANCRVSVFKPSPLQRICRELVQKFGSNGATVCFGGEKYTELDGPTSQEKGPLTQECELPTPLASQEPLSFLWASRLSFFLLPLLWVISVVIYPSLPFILLLHLSVIHAHT